MSSISYGSGARTGSQLTGTDNLAIGQDLKGSAGLVILLLVREISRLVGASGDAKEAEEGVTADLAGKELEI